MKKKIIGLYHAHARELLIFLNRITGSPECSQDLLHDVFANLMAYAQKNEIINARAFLYRTAHNLALNHIRKNRNMVFNYFHDTEPSDGRNDIALQIELDDLNRRIYELIDSMEGLDRSIFILKKETGLSIDEIAKTTGKSTRTVRRKLAAMTDYVYATLVREGFIDNNHD